MFVQRALSYEFLLRPVCVLRATRRLCILIFLFGIIYPTFKYVLDVFRREGTVVDMDPENPKGAWALFPGPFDLACTSVLLIDVGHPLIHAANADSELCMALA